MLNGYAQKDRWQGRRQILLESSGGLTEHNVKEYINNGNNPRKRSLLNC